MFVGTGPLITLNLTEFNTFLYPMRIRPLSEPPVTADYLQGYKQHNPK